MTVCEPALERCILPATPTFRRYRLGPKPEPLAPPAPVVIPGPVVDRTRRCRIVGLTPAWLLSLLLHLIALNVLAAFCFVPRSSSERRTIYFTALETELPVETFDAVSLDFMQPRVSVESAAAREAMLASAREVNPHIAVDCELLSTAAGVPHARSAADFGIPAEVVSSVTSMRQAEFFGVKATGSSFVFIIDSSASMGNGKFAAAKAELTRAIRQLGTDQSFYVLFFDNNTARMTLNPDQGPEPAPVLATMENLAKALDWIATVEIEPDTHPLEALQAAIEMQPDAIFLLSDGEFTDEGRSVRFLSEKNLIRGPGSSRQPKVLIHTIAFWQTASVKTMKLIANTHGGNYRFVPPPSIKSTYVPGFRAAGTSSISPRSGDGE